MKASSIHKDLSWPKIAHRFAKSDVATHTLAEPEPAIPAAQCADLYRVSSQLLPILHRVDKTKQIVPAPLAAKVNEESGISAGPTKFSNCAAKLYQPQTRWAALHLGLLRMAVECARLAVDVAVTLINFVKNLLRLFRFGLNQVQGAGAPLLQNLHSEAPPSALTFEPVLLSDEPKPLPAEDRAEMLQIQFSMFWMLCVTVGRRICRWMSKAARSWRRPWKPAQPALPLVPQLGKRR